MSGLMSGPEQQDPRVQYDEVPTPQEQIEYSMPPKTSRERQKAVDCLARLRRLQPLIPLVFGALIVLWRYCWFVPSAGLILLAAIPVVIALLALQWGRCIRFWWRTRTSRKSRVLTLQFQPEASGAETAVVNMLSSSPETIPGDEGAKAIEKAFAEWDYKANQERDRRGRRAVASAFLGPLAVGMLVCQIRFFPLGTTGIVLVAIELLLVLFAIATLYVAWPFGGPHLPWITTRLRAELLRREYFLYLARIGPYLRCDAPQDTVDWRIEQITQDPDDDPQGKDRVGALRKHLNDLITMQHHPPGSDKVVYWRHDLDSAECSREPIPHLGPLYVEERLNDQMAWYFEPACEKHRYMDWGYEVMATLAFEFAAVLALMHLLLLQRPSAKLLEHLVVLMAIVLPPIGAGFLALRDCFENHRLTHSYRDQVNQLELLSKEYDQWSSSASNDSHVLQQFVLRTESQLSQELRRWWLIVWPEQPRGRP